MHCFVIIKGKYPAVLSTRKHNDKHGVYLDPNHTHFILVDDGTKGRFGAGLNLRVQLEEMISTKVKVGSESSTSRLMFRNQDYENAENPV